jgi:hypothetical protein
MSLLDEEAYGDVDDFLERFGSDTPSLEQIRDLQVTTQHPTEALQEILLAHLMHCMPCFMLFPACAEHGTQLRIHASPAQLMVTSWFLPHP